MQSTEKHGSVITSEQVVGLITRNLDETTGTGDRRETKEAIGRVKTLGKLFPTSRLTRRYSRKYGPSELEFVGDPNTDEQGDDLKGSSGNLHQDGL